MTKEPTSITKYADADAFLDAAAKDVIEELYIPLLDLTVWVKALDAAEFEQARADIVEQRGTTTVPRKDRNFAGMVAYYATVNKDGTPFFRRDQIDALNTKSKAGATQPILRAALRLAGMDEAAEEAARKKHEEGTRAGDETPG